MTAENVVFWYLGNVLWSVIHVKKRCWNVAIATMFNSLYIIYKDKIYKDKISGMTWSILEKFSMSSHLFHTNVSDLFWPGLNEQNLSTLNAKIAALVWFRRWDLTLACKYYRFHYQTFLIGRFASACHRWSTSPQASWTVVNLSNVYYKAKVCLWTSLADARPRITPVVIVLFLHFIPYRQ